MRNMLRRGELRNVASQRCRRIDPAQIVQLVGDSPSQLNVLGGVLEGWLVVSPSQNGSAPQAQRVLARCRQ